MKYRLRTAVWEITLAGPFSCKYCGSGGGKARKGELNTAECLSVADQLSDLGCRRVSLIGGEVFVRPDWKTIVGRLREHNIRVNIITNGFLFKEELIDELKELSVESVSVSVDGPREVHDKYRQEGSYDRAMKALRYGIAVSLGFGAVMSVLSFSFGENLASFFTKDAAVAAGAHSYLKAYAIDCLLTPFLFCLIGFFNGLGKTKFVMAQGITGAFCVRVPASFLLSRLQPVTLFRIGLATPMSTALQILLCFGRLVYVKKRVWDTSGEGINDTAC